MQIQIAGRNGVKNWKEASEYYKWSCYKILTLPEHFSPKYLQDIVDGKMKNADKVLIECENFKVCSLGPHNTSNYACASVAGRMYNNCKCENLKENCTTIKLNSSNHITLHNIEKKMYTKEEVILAYEAGVIDGSDPDCKNTNSIIWFEQNVK